MIPVDSHAKGAELYLSYDHWMVGVLNTEFMMDKFIFSGVYNSG